MNDLDAIRWMNIQAHGLGYKTYREMEKAIGRCQDYISNKRYHGELDLVVCLAIVNDLTFVHQGKNPHALDDLKKRRHAAVMARNRAMKKKKKGVKAHEQFDF